MEGFTGVIGAHDIRSIKDVAQLISIEIIKMGVKSIEFGTK